MSEFTYLFQVDGLGPKEKKVSLNADDAQRSHLADLMDVDSITRFNADVILKRLNKSRIEARFEAACTLTQTCVVSFKPVQSELSLSFRRIFDSDLLREEDDEVDLDVDDPDLLEPMEHNTIDLCHSLNEELSLAIDPFPKAESQDFEPTGFGPEITEEEVQESSPFAILSTLKDKK